MLCFWVSNAGMGLMDHFWWTAGLRDHHGDLDEALEDRQSHRAAGRWHEGTGGCAKAADKVPPANRDAGSYLFAVIVRCWHVSDCVDC